MDTAGISKLRTRWTAIGAAVAVSLGAGGIGITQATTSSGEKPIYKPIEPCRLADLRPAPDTVGPRATPLGADETYKLSGWGSAGNCSLPSGTTGLSLNVTAIGPTLPTFLTLFPAGSTLPNASHLNPVPGQPPSPNAVNVDLDAAGEFNIYNLQGDVKIIIDVVGIYDDHTHDDRYYQKTEIDGRTQTRTIPFPALALIENASSGVIEHLGNGLDWENNGTEAAEIFIRKPSDWTGEGDVVLRMFYRRTNSTIGRVQFFTRPRDYNDGDPFLDTGGILSDVQTESNMDFYEVTMAIPAAQLPKDWWDILIQRNTGVAGEYPDSVIVVSVDLTYEAHA
jgi:hypothetical protein